jgi:hypothetical protein
MKFLIQKISALLLFSMSMNFSILVAQNVSSEQITDALQKRNCSKQVTVILKHQGFLFKKYFSTNGSENSVLANFRWIEKQNTEFLNELKSIVEKHKNKNITNEAEYNAALAEFDTDLKKHQTENLQQLHYKQNLYVNSILGVEREVRFVSEQTNTLLSKNCTDRAKNTLQKIKTMAQTLETETAKSRLLTERKMKAMGEIFEPLRSAMRASFIKLFSQNVAGEYDKLIGIIDAAFATFKINDEIGQWYFESFAVDGFGRGLWDKYYLYNQAIAQIDEDIAAGKKIHEKINALKIEDPELTRIPREQLDYRIKLLEKAKQQFEESGFASRLKMHERVVKKVEEKNQIPEESMRGFCINEYEKYKKIVQTIKEKNTLEAFVSKEQELKNFIMFCYYKGK